MKSVSPGVADSTRSHLAAHVFLTACLSMAVTVAPAAAAQGAQASTAAPGGALEQRTSDLIAHAQLLSDQNDAGAMEVARHALDAARVEGGGAQTPDIANARRIVVLTRCQFVRECDTLPDELLDILRLQRQMLPAHHNDIADTQLIIGETFRTASGPAARHALELADRLVAEAVDAKKAHFGPLDREVVRALRLRSDLLFGMGRLAESFAVQEEETRIHRETRSTLGLVGSLREAAIVLTTLGRYPLARASLEEALDRSDELQSTDRLLRAAVFRSYGDLLVELGRYPYAIDAFTRALDIQHQHAADPIEIAITTIQMGSAYVDSAQFDKGLALVKGAVDAIPDGHPTRSVARHWYARALATAGQLEEAVKVQRAVYAEVQASRPGTADEATTASAFAALLNEAGRFGEALTVAREAEELSVRMLGPTHPDTLAAMVNHATVARTGFGRYDEAIRILQDVVDAYRNTGWSGTLPFATALANLGRVLCEYYSCVDGRKYVDEAAEIARTVLGDSLATAESMLDRGWIHWKDGRYAEALSSIDEADRVLDRLRIEDTRMIGRVLMARGVVHEASGDRAAALADYQRAVRLMRDRGSRETNAAATRLADLLAAEGRWREAGEYYRMALQLIESAAVGIGSEVDQIDFAAEIGSRDPVQGLVKAELRIGNVAAAFETAEHWRARTLRLLLGRDDATAQNGAAAGGDEAARQASIDGDEELRRLRRERAALQASLARADAIERFEDTDPSLVTADAQLRRAADTARRAAERRLRAIRTEIWRRLEQLDDRSVPPVSLDAIRRTLGEREGLLFYSVSATEVIAFLITKRHTLWRVLSDRGTPLSSTQLQQMTVGFLDGIRADRSPSAASDRGALLEQRAWLQDGQRLFEALIPEQIWKVARSLDKVYAVPDRFLQTLPFEALVVRRGRTLKSTTFVGDSRPEFRYLPFAGLLMRQRTVPRPVARDRRQTRVVALANPNFSARTFESNVQVFALKRDGAAAKAGVQPRDMILSVNEVVVTSWEHYSRSLENAVKAGAASVAFAGGGRRTTVTVSSVEELGVTPFSVHIEEPAEQPGIAAVPSMLRAGGRELEPLPGTVTEAMALCRRFRSDAQCKQLVETPDPRSEVVMLVGHHATAQLLAEAAPGASHIHIGTHGIVNGNDPVTTGLALTARGGWRAGDTGWLTVQDIADNWGGLLSGVELVTLSACETSGGSIRSSEFVLGLPWVILQAGARSVVASVWRVEDRSTAVLMNAFYGALFAENRKSASQALVSARRQLRRSHPSPYFWAPFLLIGVE